MKRTLTVLFALASIGTCGFCCIGVMNMPKGDPGTNPTPQSQEPRKRQEPTPANPDELDRSGLVLIRSSVDGVTTNHSTTITGTVINRRSRKLSYAQIQFNVYDQSGAQIGSALANINGLEPGGRWNFRAVCLAPGGHSHKFHELSGF